MGKEATATADADASKTVTEELEIGDAEFKVIAEKTKEAILPDVEKAIKDGTAVLETLDQKVGDTVAAELDKAVAKIEEVNKKNVKNAAVIDEHDLVAKGIEEGTIDKEIAEMSPAMRMMKGMLALTKDSGIDRATLKKINAYTIASQLTARKKLKKQDEVAKTGYANETTAADGEVLVPDAEFVTTVFENLPNYGVAFRDADMRQTDRTSVRVISLDSGLTFYATAEGGVKTSAKLAFAKNEVDLAKYAVIIPATDELTEDAAIDYWNVVTRELTRAYAKIVDEKVFTDATSGLTNQSGVLTHTYGAAAAGNLTWDDLLQAEGKTEDDYDRSNAKWYMRKETWFHLIQQKGTTNDHYIAGSIAAWQPSPLSPSMPWGTPVVFTRVLPTVNSVSANDAIAVYGDLRNILVYNKRGMQLTYSREATIVDADSQTTNLFTQDLTALRAVIRFLVILPKGNRTKFVILGSGTVS